MSDPLVIVTLGLVTALLTVFVLMLYSVWARRRRQRAMERLQEAAEAEFARLREEILSRTPHVKMRYLEAGKIVAGTISASDIQTSPYVPGEIIIQSNAKGEAVRIERIGDE